MKLKEATTSEAAPTMASGATFRSGVRARNRVRLVLPQSQVGAWYLAAFGARPRGNPTPRSSEGGVMPNKRANVKNEKQYEGLRKKGMSKERAAKIANSPGASSRGGKKSGSKKS